MLLILCSDADLDGGHRWAAIIILSREVLVSGLREYLGELQVSVPVTRIAKWKTTVQLVAVGFLIAGPAGDTVIPHVTETGIALLWIAAGLTLYTGYDYFRAGFRHVVDEIENPLFRQGAANRWARRGPDRLPAKSKPSVS